MQCKTRACTGSTEEEQQKGKGARWTRDSRDLVSECLNVCFLTRFTFLRMLGVRNDSNADDYFNANVRKQSAMFTKEILCCSSCFTTRKPDIYEKAACSCIFDICLAYTFGNLPLYVCIFLYNFFINPYIPWIFLVCSCIFLYFPSVF